MKDGYISEKIVIVNFAESCQFVLYECEWYFVRCV